LSAWIDRRKLGHNNRGPAKEAIMALKFLGKDPDSGHNGSPTLYYDDERDTYLFQSWKVLDAERLRQLDIPDHETVIEFPRRMMRFFPEVSGGGEVRGA
jgi:hypothetical protein